MKAYCVLIFAAVLGLAVLSINPDPLLGKDSDKIDEVTLSLTLGDGLLISELFKDAINKFKDALSKAESA